MGWLLLRLRGVGCGGFRRQVFDALETHFFAVGAIFYDCGVHFEGLIATTCDDLVLKFDGDGVIHFPAFVFEHIVVEEHEIVKLGREVGRVAELMICPLTRG